MSDNLRALIESSLRFEWFGGQATPVLSHDTGWLVSNGFSVIQCLSMRTRMELVGGVTHVIDPGSALVLDANVRFSLQSTSLGNAIARWGNGNFFVLGSISVLSLFDIPPVIGLPTSAALGDRCADLGELYNAHGHLDPIRFSTRKLTLGLRLLETLIGDIPPNAHAAILLANAQRLAPVLTRIDEHLGRPTSHAELARLAGTSPSRFHALFLEVMGRSPIAYLTEQRLNRARQLLLTTTLPVRSIASSVGFQDPFHFSRAFKRTFGESPLSYRTRSPWLSPS